MNLSRVTSKAQFWDSQAVVLMFLGPGVCRETRQTGHDAEAPQSSPQIDADPQLEAATGKSKR